MQCAPWWPNSTSGISKGIWRGLASLGDAANANRASVATKRRISQALAIRSMPGRGRVTQVGGRIHLGPHVAHLLAARGFAVTGVDVKAYLASFTSGSTTLRAADEPGDYRTLLHAATTVGAKKPILIGISEGAGLSVLATSDPRAKVDVRGRRGGLARSERCLDAALRRSAGLPLQRLV